MVGAPFRVVLDANVLFPLLPEGIKALGPDAFLRDLLDLEPIRIVEILQSQASAVGQIAVPEIDVQRLVEADLRPEIEVESPEFTAERPLGTVAPSSLVVHESAERAEFASGFGEVGAP